MRRDTLSCSKLYLLYSQLFLPSLSIDDDGKCRTTLHVATHAVALIFTADASLYANCYVLIKCIWHYTFYAPFIVDRFYVAFFSSTWLSSQLAIVWHIQKRSLWIRFLAPFSCLLLPACTRFFLFFAILGVYRLWLLMGMLDDALVLS